MYPVSILAAIVLGFTVSGPVRAQAPNPVPSSPSKADPERLAAAKEVVAAAQGDRSAVLAAMRAPMVGMMQQSIAQMDANAADKAPILVDEVVMPLLAAHYDELLSVQALSFAAVLSVEDMKAVAAFYRTPAGRNLVKAQPQLTQALLTGIKQWIGALMPDMQRKIAEAAEAHGWVPGSKDAKPKPN